MNETAIQNGWLGLPSEQELSDYLMWLRTEKIEGMESISFENFASSVMDMYYQLCRLKKKYKSKEE